MTPRERELRLRLRSDFEYYAPRCLKIRVKSGAVQPMRLNEAQLYLHAQLEAQKSATGKVRALVLKGRQQGCCYSPDMRVLAADYRWVRIGDVAVGDRIIAVDEELGALNAAGRRQERRIRFGEVEEVRYFRHPAYEVALHHGVKLIVTAEHKHLCRRRGADEAVWRAVADTRVGDFIRVLCPPPVEGPAFEDGWFGGLLDGEGSFGAAPQVRIAVSRVEGAVLSRAKRYLDDRGIGCYESIDSRRSGEKSKLGNKPVHCLRIDRLSDVVRLLSLTRPARFVDRPLLEGKKLPKSCPGFDAWARVVSITPVGTRDVVDIQTGPKTFICEGIVSHNSTYTEGRFFHAVTHRRGTKAFILTHLDDATNNLFGMAKRFYEHCPAPVRPSVRASNAKELVFDRLDSGYKVGTAGSKGTGRGETIQLFHGSEIGYWPNAQTHVAGALQAVPDEPGTEVILESTSNGRKGLFFEMCDAAMRGEGEYVLVFIPWFWQAEYRKAVPEGFTPTPDESAYRDAYGLDPEQVAWRRAKIVELNGVHNFRREYPATPQEAFSAEVPGALWRREQIDDLRVREHPVLVRIVVAVDPSGGDKERNDEVGLVVVGIDARKHGYVLADRSGKYSPEGWGREAVALYRKFEADRIVAESNFGGAMVESTIRVVDRNAPVKLLHASRGKHARAEPVAALYEQGRMHHVGTFIGLEDEMVTWVPLVSTDSPNRVDALVWAATELLIDGPGTMTASPLRM